MDDLHYFPAPANGLGLASMKAEAEARANVRLCAAAPGLLAALKRVLSDDEVALSRPDYEFARAAILKAEGDGEAGGVK